MSVLVEQYMPPSTHLDFPPEIRVLLDDGHGWETKGNQSHDGQFKENHFNGSIINRLAFGFSKEKIPYQLIAPEWRDIPLQERVDREREITAASEEKTILISIHADAHPNSDANGFTVYFYKKGKKFADHLHNHLQDGNPLKSKGVRYGNYKILRETICPAVLVECGYMTNSKDRMTMETERYKNFITRQIIAAVKTYSTNES